MLVCIHSVSCMHNVDRLGLAVLSETGDGSRNLYVVDGFKDPVPHCVLRDLPRIRCLLVLDKTVCEPERRTCCTDCVPQRSSVRQMCHPWARPPLVCVLAGDACCCPR